MGEVAPRGGILHSLGVTRRKGTLGRERGLWAEKGDAGQWMRAQQGASPSGLIMAELLSQIRQSHLEREAGGGKRRKKVRG